MAAGTLTVWAFTPKCGCLVSRKFMLKSCSIRHGIPASCRMRPSSSLASTWITAQPKPRYLSMEKESDGKRFQDGKGMKAERQV